MALPKMREDGASIHSAREQSNRARIAAAAALGVAGEAVVLLGSFSSDVSIGMVLGLHLMTLAGIAAILLLRRVRDDDETMAILIFMITAVAGPAGAIAALASLPFAGADGRGRETLEAWYSRLANAGSVAPSEAMLDRIVSGRVQRPDAPTPDNYLRIIEFGTLEQRQRALGLIARQFHPDYAPVLASALRSREPVVRVQASAVVARVRQDLKERISRLAATEVPQGFRSALRRISEIHALETCALVDTAQQAHCAGIVEKVLSALIPGGGEVVEAAMNADRSAQNAIETYLIRHRRFRDLRVARRVGAIATTTGFKIRRLADEEGQ